MWQTFRRKGLAAQWAVWISDHRLFGCGEMYLFCSTDQTIEP
jgi:hypothetical protein